MKTKLEMELEIPQEIIDAIVEKMIASGDYVPVVRCKDCKYSVDYYEDGDCYCRRPRKTLHYIGNDWNWFCADGERKDNG